MPGHNLCRTRERGVDLDTDIGITLQARVKVYTMQRQQNVSANFFEEGGG